MKVARSALGYVSRMVARDAAPLQKMSEIAGAHPRYGYRRVAILLGRDGHAMSFGRAHRLWRRAGLQVPKKRGRKRVSSGRPRPNAPSAAGEVWSYDFVHDHCANGQKLKCLTITDEFTREGLAIEVDGRIRSARVIETLAKLVSLRGAPRFLRSDNGPEFVSRAVLKWTVAHQIEMALIDPGKPWQNGAGESFNGKFRDECLNTEWFRSRAEAKVLIERWRRHYNEVRPHSSLNYQTPAAFARLATTSAATRKATGRDAARIGATAPRPVVQPSENGQKGKAETAEFSS
jgi:putative transposase